MWYNDKKPKKKDQWTDKHSKNYVCDYLNVVCVHIHVNDLNEFFFIYLLFYI